MTTDAAPDFSQKLKLVDVDLSHNSLTGGLPTLSALSALQVSHEFCLVATIYKFVE